MSEDEAATKLAVHEAVCAERWKQVTDRLSRIELVLGGIVLLLLGREKALDRANCGPSKLVRQHRPGGRVPRRRRLRPTSMAGLSFGGQR